MLYNILNTILGPNEFVNLSFGFNINSILVLKYTIFYSALMSIASINPIYCVLNLVLTFVLSAVLILTLGAEFLGILLIIVYVGAIAVLFLFVVMMLNIEERPRLFLFRQSSYLSFSLLILVLLTTAVSKYVYDFIGIQQNFEFFSVIVLPFSAQFLEWANLIVFVDNIVAIGTVLYNYYSHLLILSGFILLLAMIASISLTLARVDSDSKVKYQDKYNQLARTLNGSVLTAIFGR